MIQVQPSGKKFAVKSTLDQHIISVHNKEERYRCDLCERGFSRKDYYQIHVRTVHTANASCLSHIICPDRSQKRIYG